MTEAGSLSGWDLPNVANGHESKLVEKIVQDISKKLNLSFTTDPNSNMLLTIGAEVVRLVRLFEAGGQSMEKKEVKVYQDDGSCSGKEQCAIDLHQESLNMEKGEPSMINQDEDSCSEEEEHEKDLQESLNTEEQESPVPLKLNDDDSSSKEGQAAKDLKESLKELPVIRICEGCNTEIAYERFFRCIGALWHPNCFLCHACNEPISDYEFSLSGKLPYHKSCYKELFHPFCDVCKNFIPLNAIGLIEYRSHPFWKQKYCPSHERDGTPQCCSCERMEVKDARFLSLDEGRKLCMECQDTAIMDMNESHPLYLDIQEFYRSLNMKVELQIPLLMVGKRALNEGQIKGRANKEPYFLFLIIICLFSSNFKFIECRV